MFLKRGYRLKTFTNIFKKCDYRLVGLLPRCMGDTTKCSYKKRGYNSNGHKPMFLGATTAI